MRIPFIILIMFAWINLFGSKDTLKGKDDTTKLAFHIKLSSRIFQAIDSYVKYDQFDMIRSYFADTLYMIINRQPYQCNNNYAIEKLEKTRQTIKNNDYKYTLKTLDEDTYRFSYFGYYNHDKYEVFLDFVESDNKIIFIGIVISALE
jgi:hypothetical protein